MEPDPTLRDYLDEWFTLLRTRVEPTTWRNYRQLADSYLLPTLGGLRLSEIEVRRLDLLYVDLLHHGNRNDGPLARRTVEYAHTVLHKALADAVAVGLLDDNVSDRATVPRIDVRRDSTPQRVRAWTAQEAVRFLELTADHELADLWRVALGTGMRRGELLGLRWDDVDLSVPSLRVATSLAWVDGAPRLKTTKTRKVRTLHLDEATAATIERQATGRGAAEDRAGRRGSAEGRAARGEPAGRGGSAWPLVFTRPDGSPWRPEIVTDRWRRLVRRLPGVPPIRLHDLRHTHATLLLQQGVPIKVVSERLGHTTIAMTMDIYAHVLPAMDQSAAAAIGNALG